MTTLTTYRPTYRPGLLGSGVLDDVLDGFFNDFPRHLKRSTDGYPVADIYTTDDGNTIMEFALAGFSKEELSIDIKPGRRSIMVSANTSTVDDSSIRRIARRSFQKTYVNYDDNLDLTAVTATFKDGLLTVNVPKRPETKPLSVKIS